MMQILNLRTFILVCLFGYLFECEVIFQQKEVWSVLWWTAQKWDNYPSFYFKLDFRPVSSENPLFSYQKLHVLPNNFDSSL